MLNSKVGTIEGDAGRTRLLTHKGCSGHALYGPYQTIEPGRYSVAFTISAVEEDRSLQDEICAVLDVVADFGGSNVACDFVLRSHLENWRSVDLVFDVDETLHNCEFRIFVTGVVALVIDDVPTLTCRTSAVPVTAITPETKGTSLRTNAAIKGLWQKGVRVHFRNGDICIREADFPAFQSQMLRLADNRRQLAEAVVDGVGYRGCDENSLFRAFVGTEKPLVAIPERVPFASSLCHQAHFGYEQYRFWAKALKETPKYQRKQWEFVFIAQALYERGFLKPGMKGLVFGAGQEQLPALFASFGVKILATDQAPELAVESGWIDSGQHTFDLSLLNERSICTNRMFLELVSFQAVDMNAIPEELDGQFDFCWSACAFEHLGSLEKGLAFVENSLRTLKPGGLAVHTTEYNMTSNTDTIENYGLSLYRRQDIDGFINKMIAAGHDITPVDWDLGEGFAEMVTDLAPYAARGEPHIRLMAGQYETTSIGLIIGRGR